MKEHHNLLELRRQKLAELRSRGIDPYPNGFKVSHSVRQIVDLINSGGLDGPDDPRRFAVAGRMMAINRFGKTAFVRLRDRSGQIQAYLRQDKVGPSAYDLFKQTDIGDFIGACGSLFQTHTGEWTLLVDQFALLTKALRPLPEKFHGLRDPEKRYRQRYLDLIMNPQVRDIFVTRSRIVQALRQFLLERDFLEVETPMMQPMAGGAEATPFKTHHNALAMDLFLRIAPELYLKRLVVGGFERVFEINRNFRNEGISTRHNPEFTMLEFYQAYATHEDLMAMTEAMFGAVALQAAGTTALSYLDHVIDLKAPWPRLRLMDALQQIGGLDPGIVGDRSALIAFAQQKGVALTKTSSIGKVVTKLFEALVEPQLIQPTFIVGYPVEVSPLSRRSEKEPAFTERFELFIAGCEIANGFSELNDPEDQFQRFAQQAAWRDAGDLEAHCVDMDYIEALEYGMPPTAGEGIGIDRMAMLFTNSASIREVILFPHMKPVEKEP
jgi:lysyl-tRNA synthetase class 2